MPGYGLSGGTFASSAGGAGFGKKDIDEDGQDLVFDFELKDRDEPYHPEKDTTRAAQGKGGGEVTTRIAGGDGDDIEKARGKANGGGDGTFYTIDEDASSGEGMAMGTHHAGYGASNLGNGEERIVKTVEIEQMQTYV